METQRCGRRPRSPLKFFLLVFAFSVPFWLVGAVIDLQWLPGLPLSALSAFCPMVAHRPVAWMARWCLYAVAARVLIVWLYNNTGRSVFAAALFHTMLNLSWMLFPVDGSHFDLRFAGLVLACVAALGVMLW